ncbi:MAG: L,D-transpeptidase family protein [Bacteroidales bacterium]|nr:L,D-transpeptidase family protein [Bacteroidales bacterium]
MVRDNSIRDEFSVVVGTPKTPTPELSSRIEKIVANPKWNVPVSIIQNEIIPKVKKDSTYISKNNFKVVDRYNNYIDYNQIDWDSESEYYFVQNSGNSNALGLLKFTFNNPYSVYIHDTPSKKYFKYDIRAFSHGCIRLENPDRLAQNLIDQNSVETNIPDIKKLLKKQESQVVELSHPIDIHIRYLTCEADENLSLYFYKDIYNKDTELLKLFLN